MNRSDASFAIGINLVAAGILLVLGFVARCCS